MSVQAHNMGDRRRDMLTTFVLHNALPPAHAGLVTVIAANPAFAFGFTPGFILTLAWQADKRVTH